MMMINKKYYEALWQAYRDTRTLNIFNSNISCLTTKIILEYYRKNRPIHFNFQNSRETILEIGKQLFIEFSNDIYLNHYDLPNLNVGDKLRDNRRYTDGKKHDYIIKRITGDNFSIEHTKNKAQIKLKYDSLVKNFIPIEKGSRQLKGYTQYFSELNGGIKMDFTPTHFEKRTVFIAKKLLWDLIPHKNKIPCTYLPNPNDGNDLNPIKSIPALSDCLAYFTPNYEVCYQNILLREEKIKTIIVFDTEADKIQQMIQDKARFDFNLIIISNSFSPLKNEEIPFWNWFREEIEIVNAL